jgi:ubiquinol-cytochrome c reductase subunit 6
MPKLRKECESHCPKQIQNYQACAKRIAASGVGDCEAWYIEVVNCVDHCVAPKIFKLTKGG